MNDNRFTQLLKGLKRFEPKEKTVSALKNRVFLSIERPESTDVPAPGINHNRFLFRPIFLYPAIALLLVVAIAAQTGWLSDTFQMAYLQTRMAFASNRYEKASLSLNLAELELKSAKRPGNDSARQIAYLSDVTSETDRYMSGLRLLGEPGKYSSEQCLAAYREYDDYLDELKAAINTELSTANDPSSRTTLLSLLNRVNQYQAAANRRLKLY